MCVWGISLESLLLLISLTRDNAEIQKLVTFQATFEKLLAVIEDEEGISGGIIVQDSLSLMHNLLRYNVSNQVSFIVISNCNPIDIYIQVSKWS